MSTEQSPMKRVLQLMADKNASDVYLSPGSPVTVRIEGHCVPVNNQLLPSDGPLRLLSEIVTPAQLEELQSRGELNVAVALQGLGSFRISGMRQRGSYAVVIRYISFAIPRISTLKLPRILENLIMEKRGLILMVGATGTGKSTTLASLIDYRNERVGGHILTMEDPIEFRFSNKKSIINQRQVGSDTESLQVGLKNGLRQAPDVIMIGEIRDRETAEIAIHAALTGHLVLSTLHTNTASGAIGRLIDMGIEDYLLSSALVGVMAQRLVRRLCTHCREAYAPEAAELTALDFSGDPTRLSLYRPAGCDLCSRTGYSGRTAIAELLEVDETIRRMIVAKSSSQELHEAAMQGGMRSMYLNGVDKVFAGTTTIQEVVRATRVS